MALQEYEREFLKGSRSYDSQLAEWWLKKSNDLAHQAAYDKIVRYMRRSTKATGKPFPELIVDYACGNGAILSKLATQFPHSRIVALDGSERMLALAKRVLRQAGVEAGYASPEEGFLETGPQIRLVHASLPDFTLPANQADAVLFLFPNISVTPEEREIIREQIKPDHNTLQVARLLAKLQEIDTSEPAEEILQDLLDTRAIGLNIHRLLKKGGTWFEVEYANAPLEEWHYLDRWNTCFTESAWDVSIGRAKWKTKFKILDHRFHRSSVVDDVYEQTGDPEDRKGGYLVTLLQAR